MEFPGAGAEGAAQGAVSDVTVTMGGLEYRGRVDASCQVDEKATASNTRAYFVVMYPWFGQQPPADQPQWRVTLEIRRNAAADTYPQFAFSFLDGAKSATIQTVGGSPRMGSGSVQVTRRGSGARFEVAGRSQEGQSLRATIDCPRFQTTAVAGGCAGGPALQADHGAGSLSPPDSAIHVRRDRSTFP